ncbi:regulatory alcR [Fusarium beomiforme]|uniref:Regulatory alcR n=1 Tax=Fusarium beomiforme TaxID=44412 RepID=A0A9P5A8X7_9HYPO|nr:regulatory alcR [Fusarium beomiforme]
MNWAWSQIQAASTPDASGQGLHTPVKRQRNEATTRHQVTPAFEKENTIAAALGVNGSSRPLSHDPNHLTEGWRLPNHLQRAAHPPTTSSINGASFETPLAHNNTARLNNYANVTSQFSSGFPQSTYSQPSESRLSIQSQLNAWSSTPPPKSARSYSHLSTPSAGEDTASEDGSTRFKRRRMSPIWTDRRMNSLSPFSVDQTMMTRTNNQFISANLLQIYHDVLEHNLSCWLTEVTCPYRAPGYATAGSYAPTEWGSSWSNRIYRRTINLDHAIQTAKLTRLSRSEDQGAAKAFHLAIMAFATQWAQGSRRQQQRYSDEDERPEDILNDINEEFDRNIQRNIWEQAKRALQEVADVESYRVATAELIFGLTQKPWTCDDESMAPKENANALAGPSSKVDLKSLNAELGDIISRDGLPVFMERAARKMHALKFRFDSGRRGVTGPLTAPKNNDLLSMMNPEDRGTVGLLYWLAVMLDTVSSSMSERPVVVADADSQHDDADEDLDATTNGRWNVPLFIQDSLEQPHMYHAVHWPCSYESAAEAVTKSAPVKVLLFRHVSYLQNILRRGGRGEKVEETIKNTTSLYRYWNMTHGAFFKELLHDYESVPARLQSWFVCISAHWNLGALMLADLIEYVDENELGEATASQSRLASKMVTRIREASARELSDLAKVSTPSHNLTNMTAPQMSHFHHAVNEATILTEPWTIILIRAFAKAAMILIHEANDFLEFGLTTPANTGHDFQESMRRAQDCVKGLWILGKKSDMARRSADTLVSAMKKLKV